MIFRFFQRAKLPTLTADCIKLSALDTLGGMIEVNTRDGSSRVDNRAKVLALVIMAAAGQFVRPLQNHRDDINRDVWRYLRDTNLDVITAEALVWITFLMGRMWNAEKEKDYEIYERIGLGTFRAARLFALGWVEEKTGFDFTTGWTDSMKFYLKQLEERGDLHESFASIVARSAGRRSLASPLKAISIIESPPEWIAIVANVTIFFSTIPHGFYETFKNILRDKPDRFPQSQDEIEAIQAIARLERRKRKNQEEPTGARLDSARVLKSGVVEGMAYTLYTDGSIEARLPQGTVRFASITELRNHVENARD
jgi:hypothetical protein